MSNIISLVDSLRSVFTSWITEEMDTRLERLSDLEETVELLSQVVDLSGLNRKQAGRMRGIPAVALADHEIEQRKLRAEFDPVFHIVQQFTQCKTKAETDALMERYHIAVKENDDRIRKLTEEMDAYLAGGDPPTTL